MTKPTRRLVFVLLFCFPSSLDAQSQELAVDRGFVGLSQALDRLPFTSRVMFVAAHPDDENSGVLPYVSRGLHARTALLTLTRGEGGQNLIGPDLFEALGLIRTGEMMAAGEYYGVQQFFTRAFDFGFSNSATETLEKWGKEAVLGDMVRAIRRFRPHVMVSVWRGDKSDGHGHHQAAGLLAREAFQAAGDPERFPELAREGLTPWKVQKFYSRVGEKEQPTLRVNPGQHVPLLGASYQEIASRGYSSHRSQGSGDAYSAPGARTFQYRLIFPEGKVDSGFLDDVPVRLVDLARFVESGSGERKKVSDELAQVESLIAKAKEHLRPSDSSGTVGHLLRGLEKLQALHQSLRDSSSKAPQSQALDFFLAESERAFEKALELSTGIYFEVLSEDSEVTPGQSFNVSATVVNRSSQTTEIQRINLIAESQWSHQLLERHVQPLPPHEKVALKVSGPLAAVLLLPNETLSLKFSVMVPVDAKTSTPHWKRNTKQDALYTVSDPTRINDPLIPVPLSADMEYQLRGIPLHLRRAAEYLDRDPFKGTRKIPLWVVPPVAIDVTPPLQIVSITSTERSRELQVKLANNTSRALAGSLSLNPPPGWTCEPKQVAFSFAKEGEAAAFKFVAEAGKEIQAGREAFEAIATVRGQKINQSYRMYSVLDLWRLPLYREAASEVVALDFKLPAKLKVAYIMGAGDRVPDALVQMGLSVKLLEADDLAVGDLGQYDCIIAGVRAYDVREDLNASNARLLDYVKQGGVFVVQYNRREPWNKAQYAPYPARIASNDDRVTDENSPVTILDPKHQVFSFPNKITLHDFEGWVQERGLYFIQDRDPRFKPLLASADPGGKPLDGGLLVANYGTGKYILTSYAWFRQLPEGVPGAIRIFANLISLGRAQASQPTVRTSQREANREDAKSAKKDAQR
jgi:LmbE family N-acetylglucosaminyl deacetylase